MKKRQRIKIKIENLQGLEKSERLIDNGWYVVSMKGNTVTLENNYIMNIDTPK